MGANVLDKASGIQTLRFLGGDDLYRSDCRTRQTIRRIRNPVKWRAGTGQGLLETLEAATYCTPDALGAFPQVAGITFTIDTTGIYQNGEPYSTYYRCANPGARIKDVTINGEPLDLNKTYYIATNDFSAAGGDTHYAFKEAYEAGGFNTGVALEDALIHYTKDALGGVITKEKYGAPQGRIQIIGSADTADIAA